MKKDYSKINDIVLRMKNGDKKAFEEMYKLTSSKAYFIAFQITQREQDAEDIVQDSYLTVLSKIDTLEKTEGFMGWFNRIVANTSKDYMRKKKPGFFADGNEDSVGNRLEADDEFLPEANIDRDELRDAVMEAIEELSAEKRTCVLMKYFEDMSVNDISKSIEVPVSSVKNRLFAARRELRAVFEKKGITATYSLAPFGVVSWALKSSFETFSQSFEGGQLAEKIFTGITVASAGAAVAAGSGAVAAGSGAAVAGGGAVAKAVAVTTLQKIAAGVTIAGVVAGSTLGITSVVKNQKENIPEAPTTSYTDVMDKNGLITDEKDVKVNVIDEAEVENLDKAKKYYQGSYFEAMPYNVEGIGEIRLGTNSLHFTGDAYDIFYAEFNTPETGYYIFSEQYEEYNIAGDNNIVVSIPDIPESGDLSGNSGYVSSKNYCLAYLEKGVNYIRIGKGGDVETYDMTVEYAGKEIEDMVFVGGSPEIVIGFNEVAPYDTIKSDEHFCNEYDVTLFFDSGKKVTLEKAYILGFVEGGFRDGENDVTFKLDRYNHTEKITAHYPDYYVKNIELTNLDEFCVAKIGSDGFTYLEPESYEVTITYRDGSKETFEGAKWDKKIKPDNGPELEVEFKTTKLRDREALKFSVVIGEYEYLSALCTVTGFDPIGLRLMIIGYEHNRFFGPEGYIDDSLRLFDKTDSLEGYLYNTVAASNNLLVGTFKGIKSRLGYELDYAITFYKIFTENEFDLV